MNRYWVTVESTAQPSPFNLGVGVTARDEDDARHLVASVAGDRCVVSVVVITDMRTIDQKHVAPNMGDHFKRGVWFPLS